MSGTTLHTIEFRSILDGRWLRVRSAFVLFLSEADARIAELRRDNPDMEYRIK
jgi:hypothetical protein